MEFDKKKLYREGLKYQEVKKIVPWLYQVLKGHTKRNPITNEEIVKACPTKTTTPRVRAIIHAFRVLDIIPFLLGGGSGYWIDKDPKRIAKYIKANDNRAKEILNISKAMKRQLTDKSNFAQKRLFDYLDN